MKVGTVLRAAAAAALVVAIAVGVCASQGASLPKVAAWQGKALPHINMTAVSGRKITNRTLRGKVVIIDFWATWCGPCKAASPVIQKMQSKYGKRGLVVIGADVWEQNKTSKPAKDYAKAHGYTYTFTYNNDDLAKKLSIEGIPTMLIVNRHGRIARVQVGYGSDLESILEKTLSKLL
jgi:thiol-disulfide isomerase/thioredoxin